ncbi:VOC family protein [Rhodococcus opacus]|nr:VOC family protein [Rhodococcus opacus]
MKLEVVVVPVTDVDRSTKFYTELGWRQDVTPPEASGVQFTPPGSDASIHFGADLTTAAPGSARGYLVVSDIEAARDQLAAAGVEVTVFHVGANGPGDGPDPDRRSYFSLASFSDPDGNAWVLQEVTTRLPGRIDTAVTSFGSARDLATALRRAAAAHGRHEERTGEGDPNWPDWYAEYMAAEQSGSDLPS